MSTVVNRIANRSISSTINQITVSCFSEVVNAIIQDRSEAGAGAGMNVQIIDCRRSNKLSLASVLKLPEGIFTHLPLQTRRVWKQDVLSGKLLDSSVPTYCLCHDGYRAQDVAEFLGIRWCVMLHVIDDFYLYCVRVCIHIYCSTRS